MLYHAKEPYIAGSIFAAFAVAFGFTAFVAVQETIDDKIILAAIATGLTACAVGGYAIVTFFTGWQWSRYLKWLLRFMPYSVHVNPLHPGYALTVPLMTEQALIIPLNAIGWIRKTTKPHLWDDDRDEIYVEMRVSDPVFQSVSAQRSDLRKAMQGISTIEDETVVRQFEGNVIRVLIEENRWPEEISHYWDTHSYQKAAPFTVKEPFDVTSARAQPREIF